MRKKIKMLSVVTGAAMAAIMCIGFTACGGGEPAHNHDWVVKSTTATCGESGTTIYECECGETKTEETAATGNHGYSEKVCSTCGYIDFSSMTVAESISKHGYCVEDKDASKTYSTGDLVYFGNYPQNLVENESVLSALDEVKGTLPDFESAGDWTSFGYYSEGEAADYMYYKDVTLSGVQYRGVYLTDYRPWYSGLTAGEENSYIDESDYETETVYWFEYAPIQWTVLEYRDGSMFLNAKYVLEAQPFQNTYERDGDDFIIPQSSHYVNQWQYSSLRAFLNETFYEFAFNEMQQALIQPVMLDNRTTGYSANAPYQVNQKNTEDKVFLLSYQDVSNTAYGYSAKGASRARSFTEYSVIQGLRTSSDSVTEDGEPACYYTLRSAADQSYGICGVTKKGSVSSNTPAASAESVDGLAINGDLGVLPALSLRVGKAAQGVWKDFTYDYTDEEGGDATATCSLYVPASYAGGAELPLITYIADSSYAGDTTTLAQYKAAECPKAWLTEEKMSHSPAFCLIMLGSPSASLVVSLVDKIAADYGIDENRLYLTGQSMGGITDFLINDTYPEKFAATVYVDCQPGGEVHDAQYDAILASAKFVDQKFVYIASRKDLLASEGQDDVEQVLKDNGVTSYGKLYDIDHTDIAAVNTAVKEVLDQGFNQNFFGFRQLTRNGNTAAEHMASFEYGYAVDAIFDWLLAQHK
ncbi:MAG: hypothetical protein K2G44_01070 [Clostridia bacterium]|nr:hypothetical protein [Clostridia bacterium]